MKLPATISIKDARRIIITSQLLNKNKFPNDKNKLYSIIENLGYVQIDTISVVERSHHHILWSRLPAYKKSMLDKLLEKEKKIFEYWSHAAAYLPVKDYKYSLVRKNYYQKKYKEWSKANKKILSFVYDRIKSEGELQSKDFEHSGNRTSVWWDWKPAKEALDMLFHQGHLMIAKRKGFQKVYDLTERVLPSHIDTSFPTTEEYYRHLIMTAINSHGLISEREIFYLRQYDKKLSGKVIQDLLDSGEIIKIKIKDHENGNYFSFENKMEDLNDNMKLSQIHILSPFDNLVIQRKRLNNIFRFDYQIECYVPQHKRKFGYFCLPILKGDKFIGKIDAKADRQAGTLIIKKIFIEEKVRLSSNLTSSIEKKLLRFAKFTSCDEISGFDLK